MYCFDAGGGKTPAALGEAIAIARSELNVRIVIDPRAVVSRNGRAEKMVAGGTIHYPTGVEGELFYIRSVLTETAPWAALSYQERDPTFPHHSTLDQFYDDLKFEAYRSLGSHGAALALAGLVPSPADPHRAS